MRVAEPLPLAGSKRLILLWTGITLVLLGLAGTSAWFRQSSYESEKIRLTRQAELTSDALTEHAAQIIRQADSLLYAVRLFYQRTGSVEETHAFINGLKFDKSVIDNIYLIHADGRVVISHDDSPGAKRVLDRSYFQYHQHTADDVLTISAVEAGMITGKYHFRVARRISNAKGGFAGLVLATVNPEAFEQHFRTINISEQHVVSLIGTQDHRLRARYPAADISAWRAQVESPLWGLLAKAPGGVYDSKSFFDNVQRVHVYQKVGSLPLVLVVGVSEQDIRNSAYGLRHSHDMVLGIVAVFMVMLGMVLTVMARSQSRLEQAHEKLGRLYRQMRQLALFDGLTGLPGRSLFFDRLSKELARARRGNRCVAVFFLDLDGFKLINDQHGHDAGDAVLKAVSARWLGVVREMDTVARFGGDEFAIIVGELDSAAEAAQLAAKLIGVASADILLSGTLQCKVGVSVGIGMYPQNATEMDSLLASADAAMYESKMHGKNTFTFSSEVPPEIGAQDWIAFRPSDRVGIQKIDDQHQQLVRMVNQINQMLTRKAEVAAVEKQFDKLVKFTAFHFETEHRLMSEYGYPENAQHDQEHARLMDEIIRITADIHEGTDLLALQTIKDWLVSHIEHADKPLGTYLAAKGCR